MTGFGFRRRHLFGYASAPVAVAALLASGWPAPMLGATAGLLMFALLVAESRVQPLNPEDTQCPRCGSHMRHYTPCTAPRMRRR